MLPTAIAIATLCALGCAKAQTTVPSLPNEIGDVRWNASSTVYGDFVCEGQHDMALFGESDKSGFVVMLRPAHKEEKTSYLVFPTRGRDPKNLRLTVESLDFADNKAFVQEIKSIAPSLQDSKTCKGIALGDGETDANHIYWNRGEKVFQWWSL